MREQFIPELGWTLSGKMLDIWLGSDENGQPLQMSMSDREVTVARWRALAKRKFEGPPPEPQRPCNCR